jgi:hypothetical protein
MAENFLRVIDLFLICTLNKKKPRDHQYNYLVPGGDHGIHKELLTSPWTISIVLRRCSASQSSFPRGVFLHPTPLFR